MRTDLIRRTALTAAALAATGAGIAAPAIAHAAPTTTHSATSAQTGHKNTNERQLDVRYEAQPNFYYCGPAAARNALSV
ncbi:C39 family peptidase, partial [Micromonospora sp. DT233]